MSHFRDAGLEYDPYSNFPAGESPDDGSKAPEEGAYPPIVADEKYHFDASDLDRVQRRLKQRHVQMIAIAGTMGTGLFLGSGLALRNGGPIGALLAYALVGSVAYASLCAVGEMTSHAPISGTFPHFAARWVDPALGFAVGWNYFYTYAISVPVEITAAVILITFWDTNTGHRGGYTAAICICVCLINIFGVRYFGESEFTFSLIKITMIIGLIILGLVIDLGGAPSHDRIGFRYWKDPGPFARAGLTKNVHTDRFLGWLGVLVQAAFSYQGMELVAIAASETESPRRNIAKAVKRVLYRIIIFYMLGILIIGLLVPSNDPKLLQKTGNAAQSPFVIAITRAGIKILPSVLNAGIFTSAFSAGDTFLFCSSRILYGLALRGQAPRVLTYCTNKGLPLYAVLVSCASVLLSFMGMTTGAEAVFHWFANLSTTGGFCTWWTINLTFIFFYRGMRAQRIDRKKLIYHNSLQPYLAYWGLCWTTFFILISGYTFFWTFKPADFLTNYINPVIFVGLYLFWKLFKRTPIWKPEEMDFVTGIPTVEETETDKVPPRNVLERLANWLF